MGNFRLSALAMALLVGLSAVGQVKPEWKPVIGTWEGDSVCTVPGSPCHDEHALYRIKPDKDDPDKITLEAFKVVDSRPQFMGNISCRYDAEKQILTCNGTKRDVWSFNVAEGSMDGTLTVGKDKQVYRKITLKKK
ncbi:MAG TPA: hypothetical protein VG897_14595 [Terriglobales bacterium]|nr:hypothetical protein [Terriglobales bacterium]